MKNIALFMTTVFLSALPQVVFAQSDTTSLMLERGLTITQYLGEWLIFGLLVLTVITSSISLALELFFGKKKERTKNDFFTLVISPLILGIVAGATALIIDKWSLMFGIDIVFAIAVAIFNCGCLVYLKYRKAE